jgi:hypothetical protein
MPAADRDPFAAQQAAQHPAAGKRGVEMQAAKATLALKAGEWFLRGRFAMVSPECAAFF